MLTNMPAHTPLPVVDLARAEKFYGETLGLTFIDRNMGGANYAAGNGTRIFLYERAATLADHTVLSFDVSDIEAVVSALKAKDVAFEEYDMGEIKTENGIATQGNFKVAWFKDSEGNILGLLSQG